MGPGAVVRRRERPTKDSAMSDTSIAIIAAASALVASGIGAGGAILAQFLTVRATDKASAKRFKWEQEQAIRREKAEREALFADVKRDLFATYLALHSNFRLGLSAATFIDDRSARNEVIAETHKKYWRDIQHTQAEIALVAPPLDEVTSSLFLNGAGIYRDFRDESDQEDWSGATEIRERLLGHRDSTRRCRRAMAAHLQGEPIPEP